MIRLPIVIGFILELNPLARRHVAFDCYFHYCYSIIVLLKISRLWPIIILFITPIILHFISIIFLSYLIKS